MRNFITEPDFFRHGQAERLIVDRIEIEGWRNQRIVLNIPVWRLRSFSFYDLVIRQPIPQEGRALPLFIKAFADQAFFPNNSTGFGRVDEFHHRPHFDGRVDGRDGERGIVPSGPVFDGPGPDDEGISLRREDGVEIVTEVVEAKMFRVVMFGYGNIAFGNDLVFRNDEPFPFVRVYLNDENQFVIVPHRLHKREPKKLLVRREVVVREPIQTDTIGISRNFTEFVHPRRFSTDEVWVEGQWSHGHRWHGGGPLGVGFTQ